MKKPLWLQRFTDSFFFRVPENTPPPLMMVPNTATMMGAVRSPQPITPAFNPDSEAAPFEIYFSPRGGCAAALAREIAKATISLRIQAYQLTHADIQAAILGRINAGVPTTLILDKTQQQYDFGKKCQAAGALVFDDHTVKIAHNKVALIEYQDTFLGKNMRIETGHSRSCRVLIQGSFNFTENADQSNAENMMIHRTHLIPTMVPAFDAFVVHFETRKSASMVWGTEHPKLALEFEPETLEERNERLNG